MTSAATPPAPAPAPPPAGLRPAAAGAVGTVRAAVLLTAVFIVLLCGVYPLAVWSGARLLFPVQAGGSLVADANGVVRGSRLLAQSFTGAGYFQSRPSAAGTGYDAANSSGTNLGPTSAKLANGVHARDAAGRELADPNNFDGIKDLVAAYRAANALAPGVAVPADAVTRSGSGLDPHISLANAELQAPRVARARGWPLARVHALIAASVDGRAWGVLGEPGVNVLVLNLALNRVAPPAR
jgi:K+-transporting ATPase ATPase C chain